MPTDVLGLGVGTSPVMQGQGRGGCLQRMGQMPRGRMPHLDVAIISNGPGETELGRETDQGKLRDSPENSLHSGEQDEVPGQGRRGAGPLVVGQGPMLMLLPGFWHQM